MKAGELTRRIEAVRGALRRARGSLGKLARVPRRLARLVEELDDPPIPWMRCAWCYPPPPGTPPSLHGVCPGHYRELLEEARGVNERARNEDKA